MQTNLQKHWYEVSLRQKSLIVAGCDPVFGTQNILDWCENYINAVASYVSGIKCNPAYFQSKNGIKAMKMIADFCKEKDLISIADYKISDIGSTNESWIQHCAQLGFEAITIAPYAGNIKETIDLCKKHRVAPIMMGLMSNSEFIRETDFQMKISGEEKKLWEFRVENALVENVDSLVLGATYKKDDMLLKSFSQLVNGDSYYKDVTFLVPGIGAQGGNVEYFCEMMLENNINPKRCMLNVGRTLMYSNTSWVDEAKKLQQETKKYFNKEY